MKKLIITDTEIIKAQLLIPYLSLNEQIFKKWIENKLLEAKFDLTKLIFKEYSIEKLATIYYQKDK